MRPIFLLSFYTFWLNWLNLNFFQYIFLCYNFLKPTFLFPFSKENVIRNIFKTVQSEMPISARLNKNPLLWNVSKNNLNPFYVRIRQVFVTPIEWGIQQQKKSSTFIYSKCWLMYTPKKRNKTSFIDSKNNTRNFPSSFHFASNLKFVNEKNIFCWRFKNKAKNLFNIEIEKKKKTRERILFIRM